MIFTIIAQFYPSLGTIVCKIPLGFHLSLTHAHTQSISMRNTAKNVLPLNLSITEMYDQVKNYKNLIMILFKKE